MSLRRCNNQCFYLARYAGLDRSVEKTRRLEDGRDDMPVAMPMPMATDSGTNRYMDCQLSQCGGCEVLQILWLHVFNAIGHEYANKSFAVSS